MRARAAALAALAAALALAAAAPPPPPVIALRADLDVYGGAGLLPFDGRRRTAALHAVNVTVDSVPFTNITLLAVEEVLPSEGARVETVGRAPPPPPPPPPPPRRALAGAAAPPGHPDDLPHVHLTFRFVTEAGRKEALAESELRDGIESGVLARNMRARGVPVDSVSVRSLSRTAVTGPLPEREAAPAGGGGGGLAPGVVAGIVAAGAVLAAIAAGGAGYVARAHSDNTGGPKGGSKTDSTKGAPPAGSTAPPSPPAAAARTHAASPFDAVMPAARPFTVPAPAAAAALPPPTPPPLRASSPAAVSEGSAHGWPLLAPASTRARTDSVASSSDAGGAPAAATDIPFSELRILTPIGEGSFGRVHLARWGETAVAVKLLTSRFRDGGGGAPFDADADAAAARSLLAALRREASISASLRHPNVVQFLGTVAAPPAVVCEYCRHGSLADALARARAAAAHAAGTPPPPPPSADPDAAAVAATLAGWPARLAVALGAAKGVLHLHTRSPRVVHRDLKAANVLIGAGLVAKVADFNLARAVAVSTGPGAAAAASGGSSLGTALNPRWTAPEVLSGAAPPSPASDVYSFGVLLWELAAWATPWAGEGHWRVALGVCERGERPPLPGGGVAGLPGGAPADEAGYVALMQACWAQAPADRPDFGAVIARLRALAAAQEKQA